MLLVWTVAVAATTLVTCRSDDPAPFDALYVFGDSYSDIGAGYVDGNGPTAVVYFAEGLGIRLTHPRDSLDAGSDHSLNFAVSGARTGWGSGRTLEGGERLGYGMANQVDDFIRLVETGALSFDPGSTVFMLLGGLNDRSLRSDTTMAHLRSHVARLQTVGGEHFRVGLLPTKIPAFSEVGKRLNPAIDSLVAQLHREGVDVRLTRWGAFFDAVMEEPERFGISDTSSTCAGRAIFDQDPTPCDHPEQHFYYHVGHPSTAVHAIVGSMMLEEELTRCD